MDFENNNNLPIQNNLNLKLLSYNSTGWSDYKADFLHTLLLTHHISICVLQEHFQLKSNLYKLNRAFGEYNTFHLPAHKNNNTINSGRPVGGLSILYSKKLSKFITHIQVPNSHRVQAIELKISGITRVFINCYFPTDPRVDNFDETHLLNTLQDINFIMEKTGPRANYVLLGDFNCDFERNTTFVQTIQNFISDRSFFVIWNWFQCDFTYSQSQVRNNRHRVYYSTIDHFIVSENILDECINATPIHLAENLSNHDPIFMEMQLIVENNTFPTEEKSINKRKPAWNKAKDENIAAYLNELQARLSVIQIPDIALRCENLFCDDLTHKILVDIYTLEILEVITKSVQNNIPHTNPSVTKKIIPGWKDIIKPYKDQARFWYSIWESAGRPQNTNLHIIMKNTRNKFHYMLRKVQKKEKLLRKDKFVTECLSGNVNNILKEIKQIRQQNNAANTVDGKSGSRNIAEHFKELYSDLYNTHDDREAILNTKLKLDENIRTSKNDILNKITPNLIANIIKRMKSGKMMCSMTGEAKPSNSPVILFPLTSVKFINSTFPIIILLMFS